MVRKNLGEFAAVIAMVMDKRGLADPIKS